MILHPLHAGGVGLGHHTAVVGDALRVALPALALASAWVTEAPMNSLSGARKEWTLICSSGAISVSMSMTGMPASIIFWTGWVRVPMPNAWMATKSHFCDAMLSMLARCLT